VTSGDIMNNNNYTHSQKDNIQKELIEKLYKMYAIKNRSDYTGSILKCECIINNERGIFKERYSMRSKDHIMEQIVFELSQLLGVNCCKASCRKVNDIYGSFSRFEVADINNVVPLSEYLNASELHADDLLETIINKSRGIINNIVVNLYQYIIFDYITGQHDRHLENISIYKNMNNRTIVMYPLYDNGLCCFSIYNNEDAIERLQKRFYPSRMGSSDEIMDAIIKYRHIIYPDNLINIIQYNNVNKDIIMNIINRSDKYKQMKPDRKEAIAEFILSQIKDIHNINRG